MQNNKSIYINSVVSVQRSAYTWICIDSIWSFTKFHPTYIKILKFQSISVHISSDDDKMENMMTETPLQYSCTFEKRNEWDQSIRIKIWKGKIKLFVLSELMTIQRPHIAYMRGTSASAQWWKCDWTVNAIKKLKAI